MAEETEKLVVFNGIDPATGDYLIPPMTYQEAAQHILERRITRSEYQASLNRKVAREDSLGGRLDEQLDDIVEGGWAVVLHEGEDPQVGTAMERLLKHRAQQVKEAVRAKRLTYAGEPSAAAWLKKKDVQPGDIKPWYVPRFLLLVGSPEKIPFAFSRGLPSHYAIGRLHFDTVDGYDRYVDSLIRYESGDTPERCKDAVFFSTRDDEDTIHSAEYLVKPLVSYTPAQPGGAPEEPPVAEREGFCTRPVFDQDATFDEFAKVFAPAEGTRPPAFLFSATHGHIPTQAEPEQITGAILCRGNVPFSAQSLAQLQNANVHGLVVFSNACWSAGMPEVPPNPGRLDRPVGPTIKPYLAALPKALLSQTPGGALGFIGHVEIASSTAFLNGNRDNLLAYRNAIRRVLGGDRIGLAMVDMRDRYDAAADALIIMMYQVQAEDRNPNDVVDYWGERNEVGGYILIGDPAARLNDARLVACADAQSGRSSAAPEGGVSGVS